LKTDGDRYYSSDLVRIDRPSMRSANTSSSPAATSRSLGVLLVVLFAGCASLVVAGHGGASTPRESRTTAVWGLANWPHAAVEASIGCDSGRGNSTESPIGAGATSRADRKRDRGHGFGFESSAKSLARRLNLPPPAC
jgi:hypothetical protein